MKMEALRMDDGEGGRGIDKESRERAQKRIRQL